MTGPRQMLEQCADLARAGGPELAGLARSADVAAGRLDQPMRVAVVGQIKRGKSTLVNALLGCDVAPTAQMEATFTVSEFRHGDTPGVLVHYRSPDRPPHPAAVADFRTYTLNDPAHTALLTDVRRVEYALPIELLRSFRLVDTPGLGSVHGADADSTTEFLNIGSFLPPGEEEALLASMRAVGRDVRTVHEDSAHELDTADAVVYLFDRAINERDIAAVGDFLGPLGDSMNALKAFGVLSRCDETYWPPGPDQPGNPDPMTWDPLAVAARIAEGYRSRPRTRRMFYTVLPVAGLVAMGARTLGDEEFGWLHDLGKLDPARLVSLLSDPGRFATRPTLAGVTLDVEQRSLLIRRMGGWGCLRAAGYLAGGMAVDEVREQLVDDSGVRALRETIRSHFGNRADLIKLDHALSDVAAEVAGHRVRAQRDGHRPPAGLGEIAAAVQDLRSSERALAELDVLVAYYNGALDLSDDECDELLRVTGEYGTSRAARLGLPDDADTAALEHAARERIGAWTRRLQDPMVRRPTATAARTILRSYDGLATR